MKVVGTLLKVIGGTAVFLVLAYLFYYGGQDLIGRSPAPPAPASAPVISAQARPDSLVSVVEVARPAWESDDRDSCVRRREHVW